MRVMLKSKIHKACITDLSVDYEGSIAIDRDLMREADILPYEQVHVVNLYNGARLTTYAIEGDRGEVCMNGAAARLAGKGDKVIILSFKHVADGEAESHMPKLIYVDAENRLIKVKRAIGAVPV